MRTPQATRPETITVTVRTPAGTPHPFEVRANERVDKVVRNAVRYFLQAGQLAAGEYGLALIRDGRAEDLADAARLEDYGVVEGVEPDRPPAPAGARDPFVGPPPPLVLFGAGSVNSSAAAMLAMLPRAGTAVMVDPDMFDQRRNPYRYPAALPATTGSKAAWVAGILRDGGWSVRAEPVDVATWVMRQPAPGFAGIAVSSVDRVDARADVADVLARTTLSLGVAGLALHLQREHPADDAACPYCQFVAVGHPITQMQQIADLTGLPLGRVVELIDGAQLTGGTWRSRSAPDGSRPPPAATWWGAASTTSSTARTRRCRCPRLAASQS
jgi:hypothetical protein